MEQRLKKVFEYISRGEFRELYRHLWYFIRGKNYSRDSSFRELVEEAEIRPKLKKAISYLLQEFNGEEHIGDYLEFGVSHGSSLRIMYETLGDLNVKNMRLFGFDSFEGLPDYALDEDEGVWRPGAYYADIYKVNKYLSRAGIDWRRVQLVKGWFRDTLKPSFIKNNNIQKAGIIMIDCDIYSAAKEALNFCKSLIKDQTIVFFDDWNSADLASKNLGEKKAFDEFMNENPQFEATEFDSYSFKGRPNGEIKLIVVRS